MRFVICKRKTKSKASINAYYVNIHEFAGKNNLNSIDVSSFLGEKVIFFSSQFSHKAEHV